MDRLELDGKPLPIEPGDTIASAAYRGGVRVFNRSFKFHRPRGLYCLSGDCPNCLVTVDGVPGVHACTTKAVPGQKVTREGGTPSTDFDLLSALWRVRRLLPVGFYYKTLLRPRWAWQRAEPLVRRMTGIGAAPARALRAAPALEHLHVHLVVVGGGPAGLAAAAAGAERGSVALLEEHEIARAGLPRDEQERLDRLADELRANPRVRIVEGAAAFGLYEGPLLAAASTEALLLAHAPRMVIATGAVEQHLVAPGSDRPGVWLGRAAARLATDHGLSPGKRVVLVGSTRRTPQTIEALAGVGAEPVAMLGPGDRLLEVKGRRTVRGVVAELAGRRVTLQCDAVVASTGLVPRDQLLRQAGPDDGVIGAGEAVLPDCSFEEALESGRRAALGEETPAPVSLPLAPPDQAPTSGCVCLCEDVLTRDLDQAWAEGFRSTEILKRYTTATMGTCQGTLCQPHLRRIAASRGASEAESAATTSRPPAGSVSVASAAVADFPLEYRTALHERHLAAGARMDWAGHWRRPWDYGDAHAEYMAVRQAVSVMDLGTLGKFEVAGPDAEDFVDRIYPIRTRTIAAERHRYALLLNERGFVFDDGLLCRLGPGHFYLTLSTAGAAHGEMWLQQWADLWRMRVRIVNVTSMLGAIVLAGPRARATLGKLTDADIGPEAMPPNAAVPLTVAGIECRVLRAGFLGEVSFELHHPAEHSVELWDALVEAGEEHGLRPHGLAAQDLLRLEKGHIVVGIDTDFDTHPRKLGLERMIALDKGYFLGQKALQRLRDEPLRTRLMGVEAPAGAALEPGLALHRDGEPLGYLTSAGMSHALGRGVALAWVTLTDGQPPGSVQVGELTARVVSPPFYDPESARVRA
jgi:sarcosine oxidase, subunit alpha